MHRQSGMEVDDHSGTSEPMAVSLILAVNRKPRPPIFATTKWIQARNPFSGEQDVKQLAWTTTNMAHGGVVRTKAHRYYNIGTRT